VAATIASAMLLLQEISSLAPLDVMSRAAASYIQAEMYERRRDNLGLQGYGTMWNPAAAVDRPLVIVVRNLPAQASEAGMHPMRLAAEVIRAAAQETPRVLAISLNLDPALDDPLLNLPECGYPILPVRDRPVSAAALKPCNVPGIDAASSRHFVAAALESRATLRQALQDAAAVTRVVITAPPLPTVAVFDEMIRAGGPVLDHVLLRRLAWTAEVCETSTARVALQMPDRDDALSFVRTAPSLGNLAWLLSRLPSQEGGDIQPPIFTTPIGDACDSFRGPGGIQQIASVTGARAYLQNLALTALPDRPRLGILSGLYYETRVHEGSAEIGNVRRGQPIRNMLPPGLTGQVVFIGDDSRLTRVLHLHRMPDVHLHGAIYYSNLHAPVGLRHAVGYAAEVVLGTFLGVLFAWSWGIYGAAKTRTDRVRAARLRDVVTKSAVYFRALGWLGWNLALLAGLIAATLYAAHCLLRQDVWINPLPLVAGMSLKGLLASRHLDTEHEVRERWGYFNRHPDIVWQAPIILAGIAAAWYGPH
jgi:hypothetical protein